jgi:hypothetical protein
MKKITTLIIFALGVLTLTPCFSQDNSYSQGQNVTRFGVKGGVNFSNFRVDDIEDNNMKAGLNLGLFFKMPVSNTVAIQPELLYSSKGSKITYDNPAQGEGEYRYNLNYLELPIMGVFSIGERFNVQVGPYVSYLANTNIKNMEDDLTIQGVQELDEKSFNRVDYGIAAGLGFDLDGFIIGARYNYGLNEVADSGQLAGQYLNNSKNSVATLFVGFGF